MWSANIGKRRTVEAYVCVYTLRAPVFLPWAIIKILHSPHLSQTNHYLFTHSKSSLSSRFVKMDDDDVFSPFPPPIFPSLLLKNPQAPFSSRKSHKPSLLLTRALFFSFKHFPHVNRACYFHEHIPSVLFSHSH